MKMSKSKGPIKLIGADIPLNSAQYPIKELLAAFRDVAALRDDVKLVLTGKRCPEDSFSVWNFLDENNIVGRVEFLPYYDRCGDFPVKKADCAIWISRDTPASEIHAASLLARLSEEQPRGTKTALFITSFHPGKYEGNSTLMRQWLDHLKIAGYRVHLLYYMLEIEQTTPEMRRRAQQEYDLYHEVKVSSRLVGSNREGLNVHVDDWCGEEAIAATADLASRFEYDIAIINYPFMTAVCAGIGAYTKKILLTHDSFVDRNRRMLAQGYASAGWVSIDARGEQLACSRSDIIVALQDEEARHFSQLAGDGADVRVVSPIFPATGPNIQLRKQGKLRIGYFGSSNWVNEQNLAAYINAWQNIPGLPERSELVLAGGVCRTFGNVVPDGDALLARTSPRMLGRMEQLNQFFETCDVVINPERGGTGIKIKTIEAMAAGAAVLATKAGAVGIGSSSRFHAAVDAEALAKLTAEIALDMSLLETVRNDTAKTYEDYCDKNLLAMSNLLGAPVTTLQGAFRKQPLGLSSKIKIPDYVAQKAAGYQIDEFRKFFSRVDPRGKRVLEIGSDFHLASARLFAANGATQVIATNIGNWRSDEPLPPGVEFQVGDAGDVKFADASFDIIYGIAVLEHIPDFEKVAAAIDRLLNSNGVAYLQGCPLWPSSLGHHVWADRRAIDNSSPADETLYTFADPDKNPIPHWAHLVSSPKDMKGALIGKGVPLRHAEHLVRFIYNADGSMTGSCSNFKSASDVIAAFQDRFLVEVNRITDNTTNEHFVSARAQYSESDLRTLGLELWLRSNSGDKHMPALEPKVSVIVPIYNVEDFLGECIESILRQNYQNLEVILVDDASPDRSREVAEQFVARDPRICIVTHEYNRGLGPARNTGVQNATGDYIFFIDSDDLLSSNGAITALVSTARESGCRVVVGSSEKLLLDGSIEPLDHKNARGFVNESGGIVQGLDAFLASLYPTSHYLPMRAWGTLIERACYDEMSLEFPPGEHEDFGQTPFLYYLSGNIFYSREIVITYRFRSSSISNSSWSAGSLNRYSAIWQGFKSNMLRFSLDAHVGDAAVVFVGHMIWRMQNNGLDQAGKDVASTVIAGIFNDIESIAYLDHCHYVIDSVRDFLGDTFRIPAFYRKLTHSLPAEVLLQYYRKRLGIDAPRMIAEPSAQPSPPQPPTPAPTSQLARKASAQASLPPLSPAIQAANQARANIVMEEFVQRASDRAKSLPAMLTTGDRAIYFYAANHFSFKGTIVDSGCFVGGTTVSLVDGLMKNPLFAEHRDKAKNLIRVYDLFEVENDYILDHLQTNYPDRVFQPNTSFLPVFRENLKEFAEFLDVRPGDVMQHGYHDSEDIEIFGVDLCKALPVTDFVVRNFFPRIMASGLVLQQDFIHEFHPHIHLSMLRLSDHFERFVELEWGGTVAYKCINPITQEVIQARFGSDTSWYAEVETNVRLLRNQIDAMLYDGNRWVLLLTLGMYYFANGRLADARATYQEARERFPHFEPHQNTKRMIG